MLLTFVGKAATVKSAGVKRPIMRLLATAAASK